MTTKELNNAKQLLLSDEGSNYMIGLFMLMEHKSIDYILDIFLKNYEPYIEKPRIWGEYMQSILFGDYCIQVIKIKEKITINSYSELVPFDIILKRTDLMKRKTKHYTSIAIKEVLKKHLIHIFETILFT